MTDNLRIEKDGVLIEATPWMLENHYDKIVELAHLAIRGTPVQPATVQTEPAQSEKGAELAKAFMDAAKSTNPEKALRAIRDSLGGEVNPKVSRLSWEDWEKVYDIRKSSMSHAGIDKCDDGGLSGLKQDMMSLASKLKVSEFVTMEATGAIRDVGFAVREAGIEFEFDAAMPKRSAYRMIDAIGVARRRGLTLKSIPTGVVPQDDPKLQAERLGEAEATCVLLSSADVDVRIDEVLEWTGDQVLEVEEWVRGKSLAGIDNDNVGVPPRPEFLQPRTGLRPMVEHAEPVEEEPDDDDDDEGVNPAF